MFYVSLNIEFFVFLLIVIPSFYNRSAALSVGHFKNETFTYQVTQRVCSPRTTESCSGWWLWRRCTKITYDECYDNIVTESKTVQRCVEGWLEPECTTAVCTTECPRGQICTAPPQTCECLGSGGGACSNVACSDELDCYPGTCGADKKTCMCPPGFSGENCASVNLKVSVTECSAQIYAGEPETVVAESNCVPEDLVAPVQWLSTSSPTNLRVKWRPEFSTQQLLLPKVDFVANSPVPVGITNAFFLVYFSTYTHVPSSSKRCVVESWSRPHLFKDCVVSDEEWTPIGLMTHGAQFNVTTFTQTGAEKTGDISKPGGNFDTKRMSGLTTRTYTSFRLDLESPTHCLLEKTGSNMDNCTCFPINIQQDITTDPVIRPQICGWSDAMSSIARYHVELYLMQRGGTGTLEETGTRVYDEDIPPGTSLRSYTITSQSGSGVYSLQLTVYDRANNTARARKLFNYDGGSTWKVDESVKVHIAEADSSTDYNWISSLQATPDGTYRLTVVWTGRYKSNPKYEDSWLLAAKPWTTHGASCTANNKCIDDDFGDRFGMRTINAISSNWTLLLGYTVLYQVDSHGGLGMVDPPAQNVTPITAEQTTLKIDAADFQPGDSLVVWFTAGDFVGNTEKTRLVVGFDNSRPHLIDHEFATETYDEFTSSLYIKVKDLQSGIKQINYTINDVTLRQTIATKTEPGVKVKPQNRERRAVEQLCPPEGDETCYCLNTTGECYVIRQYVNIENCVFDRYIQDPLEFNYTVTNQAGLSISGSIRTKPEQLVNVRCRPEKSGLSTGASIGIGIAVSLLLLLLLVVTSLLIWHWRKFNDPLPPRLRTIYNRTFRHIHVVKETSNPVYATSPCPPYTSFDNDAVDADYEALGDAVGMRVNPRQVQTDRTLAEGKFAVVKRGTVTVNNECLPVAVKALKRGFTAADRTLMDQKISFLSGISAHVNIVKLIASYDGGVEGPAMLLELCDLPLKDWLSQYSNITAETLEEILNFVLDIAQGVQYLHSRHVVHRRLAVRNVLLKWQTSGLVAKLIGFGPSAAEDFDGGSGNEKVTHPVRWLAPETLNTMKSKTPAYNNKTDSWSFGITVWEMYSTGQKPYPGNEQKEIKGLLQRGYRMDCPKDCPPDLFRSVVAPCWNASAKKRPEFDVICSTIVKFRGSGQQEDYYAAEQSDTYTYAAK